MDLELVLYPLDLFKRLLDFLLFVFFTTKGEKELFRPRFFTV